MSVPVDWTALPLGEIARVYSGGTPSRSVSAYWGGGIPWASTAEVDDSSIVSTKETISELGLANSAAKVAPAGTLLMAMYGQGKTRGKTSILAIDAAMNQACAAIEPGKRVRSQYLLAYLRHNYEEIRALSNSGGQENLSGEIVKKIPVLLPGLKEQDAIAMAAEHVVANIATLERLIAKKRAIKQGMMQQLLTSRTRLPGFFSPWAEVEVGNLLDFKNGLNKGSEYFGTGTPIVNFMDVMNGPIVQSGDVRGRVTLTRDEIKRFSARKGDLFFTRTSETVDEVGTAAVLVDDVPNACFSGFILRGRPKSADVEPRFLARAFRLDAVRAQVMSSATYTTRALTNGRSLGKVVLELPSVDEQRAIAKVLADADEELDALTARLTKARDIKQGMMQQLLTGRTRLPMEVAT